MKAKEKKLKNLNETFRVLLADVAETEAACQAEPSEELKARLQAQQAELGKAEVELREALESVLQDLGPVYLEIGRIIKEEVGKVLGEFQATGPTGTERTGGRA